MSKLTLNFIQTMARDGFLQTDFKLFGIPQTEEQAEEFIRKYQEIRNIMTGYSELLYNNTARYDMGEIEIIEEDKNNVLS